jgi:hypothetical protein
MNPFAIFVGTLVFFHTSEFLLVAIYNKPELGWRCEHFRHQPCPQCLPSSRPPAHALRFLLTLLSKLMNAFLTHLRRIALQPGSLASPTAWPCY